MRKMIMGVLLVLLTVYGFKIPVEAAEQTGSIQVTLKNGDQIVQGGTVTLFRVGDPMEDGYQVEDSFGGGMVRDQDAMSPHLAQWLAQQEGDQGMIRLLDSQGTVTFEGLSEGLYLFVQNGSGEDFYPVMPFLMTLPYGGQWNVEVYPFIQQIYTEVPPASSDSPRTGQHPAPIIGAVGMVASGIGLAICAGRKRKK